jgi:hypothetical protein
MLLDHVLWQTQNEGMATYVAFGMRPSTSEVTDYQLLERPAEVAARFDSLQLLIDECTAANDGTLPALRDNIRKAGSTDRVYYVVGAYMAKMIEERMGRAALVRTVTAGPAAFFQEYAATAPSDHLRINLDRRVRSHAVSRPIGKSSTMPGL